MIDRYKQTLPFKFTTTQQNYKFSVVKERFHPVNPSALSNPLNHTSHVLCLTVLATVLLSFPGIFAAKPSFQCCLSLFLVAVALPLNRPIPHQFRLSLLER